MPNTRSKESEFGIPLRAETRSGKCDGGDYGSEGSKEKC